MADDDPQPIIEQMSAAAVRLAVAAPDQADGVAQVLMHLNQLSAILGGAEHAGDPRRVLNSLYAQLGKLAAGGEQQAEAIHKIVGLLNQLAATGKIYARPVSPRKPKAPSSDTAPTYLIRTSSRGQRLIEHRPASDNDFYVTAEDFRAAIQALVNTATPNVNFDPLYKAFLAAGGTNVKSAYPLRVVLRFLRSQKPPLIAGQRGQYTMTMPAEKFRKKARQAWDRLSTT